MSHTAICARGKKSTRARLVSSKPAWILAAVAGGFGNRCLIQVHRRSTEPSYTQPDTTKDETINQIAPASPAKANSLGQGHRLKHGNTPQPIVEAATPAAYQGQLKRTICSIPLIHISQFSFSTTPRFQPYGTFRK